MNIGNERTTDHPAEFELGPAQPMTDRYVDADLLQVESNRRVIRNRRKPMFDDGTKVGSKGSH